MINLTRSEISAYINSSIVNLARVREESIEPTKPKLRFCTLSIMHNYEEVPRTRHNGIGPYRVTGYDLLARIPFALPFRVYWVLTPVFCLTEKAPTSLVTISFTRRFSAVSVGQLHKLAASNSATLIVHRVLSSIFSSYQNPPSRLVLLAHLRGCTRLLILRRKHDNRLEYGTTDAQAEVEQRGR